MMEEEVVKITRTQLIQNLKEQLLDTDYMVIKSLEGQVVDDPDIFAKRQLWREQIATLESMTDDDYMEYTEPEEVVYVKEVPSANDIIDQLKELVSTQVQELSDDDALKVAALYPTWESKKDKEVVTGERLWYNSKLWKVLNNHTVLANWTPDTATSLYVEVSDGTNEWPDWKQPVGSADAYEKGAKVTHNEKHWTSDVDSNVWEPGIYGWTEA